MKAKKKIVFLTGTRADYGKMKPLMMAVENHPDIECHIFITGMHTMNEFGSTKHEILADGYTNTQVYMNQIIEEPMDLVLANTINGFGRYIRTIKPDMILIHGDRVEALAGAITGALNNILVAHIEGGEISGTIDESIRHAVSKIAHIHFVSNEQARQRLIQLGENPKYVFIIGSPDLDILLGDFPHPIQEIKQRYEIPFSEYAILMFHPVTTEYETIGEQADQLVDAVIESSENFIVIDPNNDMGYTKILESYKRLQGDKIRRFPSIRFEFFVELLKKSKFIIGNSSVGIHEAPALGLPSINIGDRQNNRFVHESIFNCPPKKKDILEVISKIPALKFETTTFFGDGNSRERFMRIITDGEIWSAPKQKMFCDIEKV